MEKKVDLNKIFKQHLEMEAFFVGDFTVKGSTMPVPAAAEEATVQAAQQGSSQMKDSLEKVAVEVRACRKCEIGSTRLNAVPGQGNPKDACVLRIDHT